MSTERHRDLFMSVLPGLKEDLIQNAKRQGLPEDAISWFSESLEHNLLGGKLNRGLAVIDSYQVLAGSLADARGLGRAAILGWCIELLQACFLVADDMMDGSSTRRGKPCWYLKPGVDKIAINDAFMLEAALYDLLRLHFRDDIFYSNLVDLFHLVSHSGVRTEHGQLLDLITAPEDNVELSRFSMQRYQSIVRLKTAYYSFHLPVAAAMLLCGITDQRLHSSAEEILVSLGVFFQIQDDYLDCYGDPAVIGKVGTDIQRNKCSWNINMALTYATAEQRGILLRNYGRPSPESVLAVKEVFKEEPINLSRRFAEEQLRFNHEFRQRLEALPIGGGLCKEIFELFWARIKDRQK